MYYTAVHIPCAHILVVGVLYMLYTNCQAVLVRYYGVRIKYFEVPVLGMPTGSTILGFWWSRGSGFCTARPIRSKYVS